MAAQQGKPSDRPYPGRRQGLKNLQPQSILLRNRAAMWAC